MARFGGSSPRRYQRTDRLNELLREVVAETLARVGDDDRLRLLTITGVETHPELIDATVFYAALGDDDEALGALEAQRHRLQRAIASQIRARRTPVLHFRADEGIRSGRRVDELLRDHPAREGEVRVDADAYRDGTFD